MSLGKQFQSLYTVQSVYGVHRYQHGAGHGAPQLSVGTFPDRCELQLEALSQQVFRVKKLVGCQLGAPNLNYLLAIGWLLLSCYLASL